MKMREFFSWMTGCGFDLVILQQVVLPLLKAGPELMASMI
jgi:hypothetical protein